MVDSLFEGSKHKIFEGIQVKRDLLVDGVCHVAYVQPSVATLINQAGEVLLKLRRGVKQQNSPNRNTHVACSGAEHKWGRRSPMVTGPLSADATPPEAVQGKSYKERADETRKRVCTPRSLDTASPRTEVCSRG